MKNILRTSVLALALVINSAFGQTYKIYTGLLHGHSSISDGSGTPEEAFKMAKQAGLNFFALTEHNHAAADGKGPLKDGLLIATNNDLYNGPNTLTVTTTAGKKVVIKPLIKAAKDASTPTFLALYGQEFSTISSGNHVNVFGINEVLTAENGNFKGLADVLDKMVADGKPAPVVQMNHPGVGADLFAKNPGNDAFNDYGIDEDDLGPHFKNMVKRLDPYVSLIEILTGPALMNPVPANYKYKKTHESDYFFYLKQGFHISPSAGQDNHHFNWGTSTTARVGVLATALTEKDLYDGFMNNRTFATDDKNLTAYYKVNGNVMGSSISADADSDLDIDLIIEDKDETTAEYEVTVYGSSIKAELSTSAEKALAEDGELINDIIVKGNGTFKIKGVTGTDGPAFIYIKIKQTDGDRLWTAPVWLNYKTTNSPVVSNGSGAVVYYWTSGSSKSYHKAGCSSIKMIKPENLQEGTTPPADRKLHVNCTNQEEEDH